MRDKPNGFWHGNKPYIVCCAIPNFWQVNGKSIIETLAPMQKMLWFIQNQRLDNLKLLEQPDLPDPELTPTTPPPSSGTPVPSGWSMTPIR